MDALEETIDVLNSLATRELDDYYDLTNKALPQEKDLLLIFNELAIAAEPNQVTLGGMTINLGDVYSREKVQSDNPSVSEPLGSPVVNFDVVIEGSVDGVRGFAQNLYKLIPLVEFSTIEVANGQGNMNANFFYNQLANTSTDTEEAAKPFTEAELSILSKLREWDENSKLLSENGSGLLPIIGNTDSSSQSANTSQNGSLDPRL